jgi:hypothetical protein
MTIPFVLIYIYIYIYIILFLIAIPVEHGRSIISIVIKAISVH